VKKKIIISAVDLYLIDKIRELRISSTPAVSDEHLSLSIGQPEDFISGIEKFEGLYSTRQLNLIANYFNISISDLFPRKKVTEDLLELEIELLSISPTSVEIDKYGNVIKNYRITDGRIIPSEGITTTE